MNSCCLTCTSETPKSHCKFFKPTVIACCTLSLISGCKLHLWSWQHAWIGSSGMQSNTRYVLRSSNATTWTKQNYNILQHHNTSTMWNSSKSAEMETIRVWKEKVEQCVASRMICFFENTCHCRGRSLTPWHEKSSWCSLRTNMVTYQPIIGPLQWAASYWTISYNM